MRRTYSVMTHVCMLYDSPEMHQFLKRYHLSNLTFAIIVRVCVDVCVCV
jgi:hypothetical protein